MRKFVEGAAGGDSQPDCPYRRDGQEADTHGKDNSRFSNGRMPAYLDTGLNFVCRGRGQAHVLASRVRRCGREVHTREPEPHLEGIPEVLAGLTGRKPPRWRLPYRPVLWLAQATRARRGFAKRSRQFRLMAFVWRATTCFTTVRRLFGRFGMAQNSVETATRKAIDWYRGNGYVPPVLRGEGHD